MSSLKFENCPFCNQSWGEIEGLEGILECYCQDCDAKYLSNDNELYRYNFPEENQVLIWSYNEEDNNCSFYTNHAHITLPLLPINISKQQFNKLITFI